MIHCPISVDCGFITDISQSESRLQLLNHVATPTNQNHYLYSIYLAPHSNSNNNNNNNSKHNEFHSGPAQTYKQEFTT
jgi:hypothetical protein